MRSWDRVAGWASFLVATSTVLTLACGGSDDGGVQLDAVAFGNGTFVAVGVSDLAYVDSGPGWVTFGTGVPSLNDVAYGRLQNLFVAVGDGGAIVTSSDGTAWTQQLAPTGLNLHGVTEGAGFLLAVGDGGTILRSEDGVTWTQQASGTEAALYGVTYSEDLRTFMAVGAGSTVAVSSDFGVAWTVGNAGGAAVPNDLFSVAFGSSGWVAVGAGGAVLVSGRDVPPESFTWQASAFGVLPNLNDVAFAQGIYVIVGDEGTILNSPDGATYGFSVSDTGQFINGVAYGNGNFVAVATGGRVLTSIDAVVWQNGKI
ncbi:MAG: cell wall-binding protein [Thermodesulfobacteriota bacterium]